MNSQTPLSQVVSKIFRLSLSGLFAFISVAYFGFNQAYAIDESQETPHEINQEQTFEMISDQATQWSLDMIHKANEFIEPYYKPHFDKMVTWYDERNIEADYLKGVIKIKTLDFFLLAFGFLFGGYIIIRSLIHS